MRQALIVARLEEELDRHFRLLYPSSGHRRPLGEHGYTEEDEGNNGPGQRSMASDEAGTGRFGSRFACSLAKALRNQNLLQTIDSAKSNTRPTTTAIL